MNLNKINYPNIFIANQKYLKKSGLHNNAFIVDRIRNSSGEWIYTVLATGNIYYTGGFFMEVYKPISYFGKPKYDKKRLLVAVFDSDKKVFNGLE